jgi:hypothetical protein
VCARECGDLAGSRTPDRGRDRSIGENAFDLARLRRARAMSIFLAITAGDRDPLAGIRVADVGKHDEIPRALPDHRVRHRPWLRALGR